MTAAANRSSHHETSGSVRVASGEPPHFPSRRELRRQRLADEKSRRRCARKGSRRAGSSMVRGTILTALALATVALPAAGFVGPQNTMAMPSKFGAIAAVEESWVDSTVPTAIRAADLDRVDTAVSRVRVRTPLELRSCSEAGVAANGERKITEAAAIVWPLMEGSFTYASPFGMRFHPVLGTSRLHAGVDLAGALGTPIFAAADGIVVESNPDPTAGYWVLIEHHYASGEVFYTGYGHMYSDQVEVKVGDQVVAGQQIAGIGSNGYSTGPHLHFEVHDATNTPIDPWPWLSEHDAQQPGASCQ